MEGAATFSLEYGGEVWKEPALGAEHVLLCG